MAESDYGVSGVNAFWAPIQKKIEQSHADEEDLKKQKREFYSGIATNPQSSDDVRNWAAGEHAKLLNPEIAKKVKGNHSLMHGIATMIGMGGDAQSQPTAPIPAPPPGAIYDTPAANKRTLDLAQQKSDIEQARQVAVAKAKPQAGSLGKASEYRNPSDPTAPPVFVQQHNKTGQYYDLQGKETEIPEGYQPYKAPVAGAKKTLHYTVDGPDGKPKEITVFHDSKDPTQFFDDHGKPLTLPENAQPVDEEAKLAKIRVAGYGTGQINMLKQSFKARYPDISDEDAERMAGEVYLAKEQNAISLQGAGRSTDRPMVVNGEVRAVPLVSQPVRNGYTLPTPPPGSAPVAAPNAAPSGPVPAPGSGGAPATRVAPPARAGGSAAAAPVPAPAAGRVLGVPPAQYRGMLNDFRAVRAGASQLFGDPNTPEIKGLVEYGDLADNKESRDRLGNALRLTFDGLNQASSGGHAGVGGDGATLNVGGIGTYVGNTLGIPQKVASQQARMFQDAIGSLTPREREAYNATIASAEGIIGLRRITGASPSQQSVRAIQEALPIIGVNTTDKKQFDDKSRRLAVEFSAGTRGIPRSGFDSGTLKQLDEINDLPKRLAAKTGPVAAPSAPVVNSKSEYDKLAPGTIYIEDGKRYKKPKP